MTYGHDELLEILSTPPRGNASLILAHALIAAKLSPEAPRRLPPFADNAQITDARDVKVGMTNTSLFAYAADGKYGLRVLQLTSPDETPGAHGFSPEPTPRPIATYKTRGPALAVSEGIDRDRAVDESGNQTGVFGRLGSRPFTLPEMLRMYWVDGKLLALKDEPPRLPEEPAKPAEPEKKPPEEKKPAPGKPPRPGAKPPRPGAEPPKMPPPEEKKEGTPPPAPPPPAAKERAAPGSVAADRIPGNIRAVGRGRGLPRDGRRILGEALTRAVAAGRRRGRARTTPPSDPPSAP